MPLFQLTFSAPPQLSSVHLFMVSQWLLLSIRVRAASASLSLSCAEALQEGLQSITGQGDEKEPKYEGRLN